MCFGNMKFLGTIPIRILHKVYMLPISLFPRAKDRLAAYASQMLQSIPSALIFVSYVQKTSKLTVNQTLCSLPNKN